MIVLSPGDYYGLLHPAVADKYEKKNKRMISEEGCEFIRIPYQIVNMLVNCWFSIKQVEAVAFFKQVRLFQGLSPKSMHSLVLHASRAELGYRQLVYDKGDQALHVHFILRGSVLINSHST